MADGHLRFKEPSLGARLERLQGPAAHVALSALMLVTNGGANAAAAASIGNFSVSSLIGRPWPQIAIGVSVLIGAVAVTTLTALWHMRERRNWQEREQALLAEVASLREAQDRADLLLGSEPQVVLSWTGRDSAPRCEGDPTIAGEDAGFRQVLAFASWLRPTDAAALESGLERLKERGEGFQLTARTLGGGFVEAQGHAAGGRALIRLRDITGERLQLLQCRHEVSAARADLASVQRFLDAIGEPVWLRDEEGRLAWVNQACLAALGAKTLEEVRARRLDVLDQPSREAAALQSRAGETFSTQAVVLLAGARHIYEVTEHPIPGGSAGIAIDVSEIDVIRADLQRQMEAHVRTLDQLQTAVVMFDAKQRLVFYNAAYRQLWDLDAAFLASRPMDGHVLDRLRDMRKLPEQADYRTWKADVLGAYRAAGPKEVLWHLPDGRTLRVVTNPDPQGGLTYLFDDLSERVRLEAQYNALIRAQSETLDSLKEGVAVFGPDGRLKLFNRAFVDMWKLPREVVTERPHIDAIVKLCRGLAPQEDVWTDIRGAVAGLPDMRMGLSFRLCRTDGSVLDSGALPLPDGSTLLTFVDMTASVNVERALTEKNDALERAAQLRDDFVHHVSYELRSPLTNIIGFTQLLGDETVGALNPRQREYADHIMRSSGALLAIINDILDLASIDTGAMELTPEVVDILDTIDAAVRGVEDRLAEASLELVIDADPGIGCFIADGKRVRQVLFNLLSNAIGFSEPGQTIRIGARKNGEDVIFEVTDQGRGIPPEVKDRVFDRFESHALGTRHRGVGLGLSIVRSFVELHGGRVDLASTPGAGTTVTCAFPANGAPQRLAAA